MRQRREQALQPRTFPSLSSTAVCRTKESPSACAADAFGKRAAPNGYGLRPPRDLRTLPNLHAHLIERTPVFRSRHWGAEWKPIGKLLENAGACSFRHGPRNGGRRKRVDCVGKDFGGLLIQGETAFALRLFGIPNACSWQASAYART